MQPMVRVVLIGAAAFAAALAGGCQDAYYRAMEAVGKHKRQLLVERVEDARDGQEEAKQQFRSALDTFLEVTGTGGGDLEAAYRTLKAEHDRSEAKAESVRGRIAAVDEVARALFQEWESELDQYTSDELRLSSEIKLRDTQKRYAELLRAMRRAEAKMDPILAAFRDQVLYLKHNLNARAVASLGDTVRGLEDDVAALIDEMEASVREADEFIRAMGIE